MSTIPSTVRITEVGPRDGLQNQPGTIPTDVKVRLVDALSASRPAEIEVSSFVSPKWVPQLADAADLLARIKRVPGIVYSVLVPNMQGLEGALQAEVEKISVFTAASETFNRRNVNATIDESIVRFVPVIAEAKKAGKQIRGYISCAIACPYEGPVDPQQVAEVSRHLVDAGVDEIDLGDTIGVAVPSDIDRLYDAVGTVVEPAATTLHMHDTRGTGLACIVRAMELGVARFDCSVGGLGGCPYAPGAAGNIATEDVVYCLHRMGIDTGIDFDQLIEAGRVIAAHLAGEGRSLPGRMFNARCAAQGLP
ncbi:MAG: hydroxymethylglutaryl-CoA lyase [Planctomycetes bacterium]|nr:hydroxymethylglutaryl-CoA lyase [Planctomycetota bacterium]NOG55021.1 hydroxymethylglutaryl-CoA lyase [Planctomycetota bacterium]